MKILIIALLGINFGISIIRIIDSEGESKQGWISSALGWLCAIAGYFAFYNCIE